MEVGVAIGMAALDTLLGELLKVVVEAKDRAIQYGDILARVERRLRSITPIVEQISRSNAALHRPREEVQDLEDILQKGKIVVEKCLNDVKWWNCCYTRPVYAGDLLELEASLKEYTEATLLLQIWRDVMEIQAGTSGDHSRGTGFGIGGYVAGTCAVPEESRFDVGLEVHVDKLRNLLLTSDSGMIVVSAPGGYGKTTLANKLCHDQQIKSRFDKNILYVPVSSIFDVKIIIKGIFQYLQREAPEFRDDNDAINRFRECLSSIGRPILLVLDDVWAPAQWLLERLKFQISGYKILVTSRFEFPGLGSPYRLQGLSAPDAESLLRKAAALPKENSKIPDDLVRKMVEFCKGIPLALSVVGHSLRGKPLIFWKKKEKEWSRGVSVLQSEERISQCLRLSLDVLDDEDMVKKCFLDMSSFPEDKRIPVTALIDMWEELYGPDDDNGVSAMAHIYNLCYYNLARLIVLRGKADDLDSDDYYNGLFVTQHDLLRELANQESSRGAEQNRERLILNLTGENSQESERKNRQFCCIASPFPCTGMKHQRNRARLLSISTDQKFSSNWPEMRAPEAEVLVLNIWSGNYSLPNFMKKMKKLKVLMATNYGFHSTSIDNFQVIASVSALRRIRLEHVAVPCLGSISVKLENLKKISFVRCKLDQAFTNSDISIAHVFPNLVEISIEYSDELLALPEDLCDLVHLKRLSITNCHKLGSLPEGIGKLVNLEMLRLSCCFDLTKLPESIGNLHKLQILDISRCFSIERLPEQVGQLRDLRKQDIQSCRLRVLPASFQNRQELDKLICICDEERKELWRDFHPKPTIKIVETNHSLDWLYS